MAGDQAPEVDELVQQLALLRQRQKAATAVMTAATASATSSDSTVTVTSGADGALHKVSFAGPVIPGPGLAAVILQASLQAQQRALDAAGREVGGILGEQSGAVAVLRRQAGELRVEHTAAARGEFGGVPNGD